MPTASDIATDPRPVPKPGILDIAAYVPGRETAGGNVETVKLSSNETPLGPSPAAVEAAGRALERLALYPDGAAHELKDAIADAHGLDARRLIVGNGSDELLGLACQCFLAPGDEAIHTSHGFLVYNIQIKAAGATPVVVPETDLTADVDAILSAVSERTRLVFLANPNNPTGTYLPHDEVRRLHGGLRPDILLVLDGAYAEYVRRNDYSSGLELAMESENVLATRTFSKIHGLAALRIGWGFGAAHLIDAMNRVRGPFNVNAAAIAAGAAAIGDRAHVERAVAHNERWLPVLRDELTALGLRVTPSVANFVLVHFPDEEGRRAADADAFLLERGFVLRRVAGYGLPNALRMTIGSDEANRGVIGALAEFMDGGTNTGTGDGA